MAKNTTAEQTTGDAKYDAKELAASGVLGAKPECVTAALKLAGKEKATISEAKAIVEGFLRKEIK